VDKLRRAKAPYRFRIPDDLVPRLRELRSRQKPWSDLVDAEDVVHLYYGLGPALFLAFDGRVIMDDYFNETGVYEVSDPKEAWVAVAVGADLWGVPELRRLLPERPAGAADCPQCKGSGRLRPAEEHSQGGLFCWECGALGWLTPRHTEPGAAPDPARDNGSGST
jgi:hypothetical protein